MTPFSELGPGSGEAAITLDRDANLTVRDGSGTPIASWSIDALPDAVPSVSFVGEPRATHRSVLKVDLEATDDYGVAEVASPLLAPPGREEETERLTLLKPGNQPPKVATGTYQDLTAHPLAGPAEVLRLEAVDAIGQRGQSGPLEIVLPAREFRHAGAPSSPSGASWSPRPRPATRSPPPSTPWATPRPRATCPWPYRWGCGSARSGSP